MLYIHEYQSVLSLKLGCTPESERVVKRWSCIKAVRDRVLALSKDIGILKKRGQIALTERQMKIVERIIDRGKITNREIREMFHISNRAAMDEIFKLLKLKVIKSMGKGRSVHYVLE